MKRTKKIILVLLAISCFPIVVLFAFHTNIDTPIAYTINTMITDGYSNTSPHPWATGGTLQRSTLWTTHPWLTKKAIAHAESLGVSLTPPQKYWIMQGSVEEDFSVSGTGEGTYGSFSLSTIHLFHLGVGLRYENHFLPAITGTLISNRVTDAYSWASNSSKNYRDWTDGLASSDEETKFKTLGHILHLIEDMAVPAHTRKDIHALKKEKFEKWTGDLNYQDEAAYNKGTVDTRVRLMDFTVTSPAIIPTSLQEAFQMMRDYTAANYVTEDTLLAEDTTPVSGCTASAIPAISYTQDNNGFYFYNSVLGRTVTIATKGWQWKVERFLGQTDNQIIDHLKTLYQADGYIPKGYISIDTAYCKELWSDTASRAVGLAAEIIKLYSTQVSATPANWTLKIPVISPSARQYHAMAYDSARDRTVLFGGYIGDGTTYNNETWEWNGTNWTQRAPVTSPSKRDGHAMAYDSTRSVTVLFGGLTGGALNNETWEWNGTNWTQRTPVTSPSIRDGHAMVYDSTRGVMVLFGGRGGGTETWEWNGTNWTQRTPVTSPSYRYDHAMAYDSALGITILFGGYNGSAGVNNETWEWNGTNWTQRTPVTSPSVRQFHTMAYDSTRGVTVLFGGFNSGVLNNETWEWNGTNWTQRTPVTSPSTRWGYAMVYDLTQGRTVLFGGYAGDGTTFNNETWEWGSGGGGGAPAQVGSPTPTDGLTNVSITQQLNWGAASGATSYDVYFGTNNPPSNIINGTNQAGTSYNPGTLANYTIYYWRIDSRNSIDSTTGNVWSFKTAEPATFEPATFNYTGGQQTFVVPDGVTAIQVDVRGASGGDGYNGAICGKGARVQTTLFVTPGQTLYIYIGGCGVNWNAGGQGGYNGGGACGNATGANGSGGGGSDIRQGGTDLSNRVVVAGGGGGGGGGAFDGGAGGYPNGEAGGDGSGAGGGTQSAGGSGQNGGGSGTLGVGGQGGGPGGGGGYYGGGGDGFFLGGGGGSSYGPLTRTSYENGYQSGNGQIIITPASLGTYTFTYTGGQQQWVVPAGVTAIQVDVKGASGGASAGIGGNGARVQTTLSVTPGETLYIYVGGRGAEWNAGAQGGYNGGGNGDGGSGSGGGGGGGSDIRQGGTAFSNRIVVAGGGGGGAYSYGDGGVGGYPNGGDGTNGWYPGYGGTQSAGGLGGSGGGYPAGGNGVLSIGGNGGAYAGGGGGGYYGGGGGAGGNSGNAGGGGSSYSSGTGTTYTSGYQNGNGQIIITY